MATIIKREGKKGVSYKIQVAVKDDCLGKIVTQSTTWKPERGMTAREIETACIIFAEKYEKQVKESFKTAETNKLKVNVSFSELSAKWFEKYSTKYCYGTAGLAKESLKKVLPLIGGYKIKDITPAIVQFVFDKIDDMKKVEFEIYPKLDIKEILEKNGTPFSFLRKQTELNPTSINCVSRGRRVGLKFASMFADVCNMEVDRLFNIKKNESQYAQATKKRFKTVIYNVLAYAVRLCLIENNYASSKYVDYGKMTTKQISCMTEKELSKFYSALLKVEHRKWRISVMTILLTGMRRGELCGLNWDDINLEDGKIFIQRSYSESPYCGLILKEPKTEKSKRCIAIPNILLQEIKDYKIWYEKERENWGDRWIDSGSFITKENGERVHPTNIKMWVSKTCELAGIKHFSVHSLRHTNITLQIMAGVPIVTVAGRAGHARTSTTTDIYAYYVQSSDRTAAHTLDNIFAKVVK